MNEKQIFGIILAVIAVIIMFTGVGAVIGVPMLGYAVKNLAVKKYNDGASENNKKCENERRANEIKSRQNSATQKVSSTTEIIRKNESYKNDIENPNVQYKLGDCYYVGRKVEKNLKTSFMHYKKAADKGHTAAEFMVGLMYYRGEGISKDTDKGLRWIERSAGKGNSDAKEFLKSLENRLLM